MLPALFAVSVAQISIIINTNIASHLATGSVTWLAFADRLMEFPTALLGVALGTVLLPSLSGCVCRARVEQYSHLLDWGLRLVFLLALPAAVGLGMTAEGIVSVLFQGREFTAFDVRQTALAVIGYSVGLLGLIAVKILAPGFYAQKDIRTPVKIAIVVLIATQIANLALVPVVRACRPGAVGRARRVRQCACTVDRSEREKSCISRRRAGSAFIARLALALAVLAAILWWASGRLTGPAMQDAPWQRVAWLVRGDQRRSCWLLHRAVRAGFPDRATFGCAARTVGRAPSVLASCSIRSATSRL